MRIHVNIALTILFSILIGFSCSKDDGTCDENVFCDTLPYDSGWLNVKVSFDGNGIPIKLYRGLIEDGNLISEDTAYDDVYYYYLPLNNRYSAEAYYNEAFHTVIALNSVRLKQSSFYNCGEECYEEADIDLDLKKL